MEFGRGLAAVKAPRSGVLEWMVRGGRGNTPMKMLGMKIKNGNSSGL